MYQRIVLPRERSAGFSKRDEFVLCSRVRIARNIDALPFPAYLPLDQKKQIERSLKEIMGKTYGSKITSYDTSKLDSKTLQNFEADLLITGSFSQFGDVFFAEKTGSWVLLPNEKDHLRLFTIECGSALREMSRRLGDVLKPLEEHIHFAFHPSFGYLTAYADDAGTALSLSYLLNLAGVEMTGQAPALAAACEETGYRLTPYTGVRGSQLFFLKNIGSFGTNEDTLIGQFQQFADKVWGQESQAREKLFSSKEDMDYINAQIMDAANSKNLSYHALLEAVALTDMLHGHGCTLNPRDDWRNLIFSLHPHSVLFNTCSTKEEIESLRSELFRSAHKKYIRI